MRLIDADELLKRVWDRREEDYFFDVRDCIYCIESSPTVCYEENGVLKWCGSNEDKDTGEC